MSAAFLRGTAAIGHGGLYTLLSSAACINPTASSAVGVDGPGPHYNSAVCIHGTAHAAVTTNGHGTL
jgi:hypothetical protein